MGHDRKMGHVQSPKVYFFVLLGLFALTVVTVLASLPDLGIFNDVVAVGIAACKASLVVMFFMHGRFEGKITWAFIWYPLVLLGLLLGGLFLDYGNRFEGKMDTLGQPKSVTVLKPKDAHGGGHDASESHGEDASHDEQNGDDHGADPENHSTDGAGNQSGASGDH